MEAIALPIMLIAVLVHVWGTRTNKKRARKWIAVHLPVLDSEFSLVGYITTPKKPEFDQIQAGGLVRASANLSGDYLPDDLLKEKTTCEYESYATGRANVAFVDMKLQLIKRYNPVMLGLEYLMSLFLDSFPRPCERAQTIIYTFDGKEKDFVPSSVPGMAEQAETLPRLSNSSYDSFVFAIVHKMAMRRLRDERYDVSLTFTKDHAKLPDWATVMTESAEVTENMLTNDLVSAIELAGDNFEYLVISDQPIDKPTTLNEAVSKKRLHLSVKVPADGDYTSNLRLFAAVLRFPDHLAHQAHFRPEVLRKINATREAEKKKLKKVSEAEAEEERTKVTDKLKKEERDRKMRGMTAEEQRKFLEKEAERNRKKTEKKMSRKV